MLINIQAFRAGGGAFNVKTVDDKFRNLQRASSNRVIRKVQLSWGSEQRSEVGAPNSAFFRERQFYDIKVITRGRSKNGVFA